MENLLSDKWDNLLLNELKQDGLVQARTEDPSLNNKAVFLYDNSKMTHAFKSDYLVLEATSPEIVLVSKDLFVRSLEGKDFSDRDTLVAASKKFVKNVGSHPDTLKTPVEDFVVWAEQSELNNVVESLNLKKKPGLKM